MMSHKPRLQVAFILSGNGFNPEDVSSIVRLTPTATWRAGDSVRRTLLKRSDDAWLFELAKRETYEMDGLLCDLLDIIEPHIEVISEAADRFHLNRQISFAVYIRGETPSAFFPASSLRRIAKIGADFDIDLILSE